MTVAWITNPGGLFTRLGRFFRTWNNATNYSATTIPDDANAIYQQFPSSLEEKASINDLWGQVAVSQSLLNPWIGQDNSFATQTLVNQVNADAKLNQVTLQNALVELIVQMQENSQSIQRPTVGSSVTASVDNDGDAVLYASVVGVDGTQQDYVLAETVNVTCTADGGTGAGGGGTTYAETFRWAGDPAVSAGQYNWPQGSGASGSINVTDAATTSQNLLTNGGFSTWTSATAAPTGWIFFVGTAGTSLIRAGSADAMRSEDYALEMVSDGATVLKVRQQVTLTPDTVYAVNLWAKINSAAAGQVAVRLVDASGTVIQDNAGTNNTCPINTASLTTTYQPMEDVLASGTPFFRTARSLPSTVYLEIAMTTPPVNGTDVFIDLVALVPATRLYVNGPFIAMFSGETASVRLDYYQDVFTNSRTSCQFVFCMDRAYGLQALGLKIPSSSSPTIPDALINNTLCTTTTTSTTTTTTTT